MNEYKEPIPSRIYNAAVGGHVAGTEDIFDDAMNKDQHTINIEITTAVNGKLNSSEKGAVNGVASLDEAGKVPSSQLPSYVDDVIEGYLYEGDFYSDAEHTEIITPESDKIYIDLISNKSYRWTGSVYFTINNPFTPDEEDLTVKNDKIKLADKAYDSASFSGMGRVYLRKNMVSNVNTLTQDMFYKGAAGSRTPNTNTVFIIQYDYTLAEDITIPDNCVLRFDGGSISGAYTITGQNTILIGKENCIALTTILAGSWKADVAYSDWFSVVSDCILNANMTVNSATDSVQGFSNLFLFDTIKIKYGNYYCSHGFGLTQVTHKFIDGGGASIKIIPQAAYAPLFYINYGTTPLEANPVIAKDVIIKNLHIIGNKTEETASAGDRGCDGLHFGWVDGLILENISCDYCGNDGLYLGNVGEYPKNVFIKNCRFTHNYRNNISVTSGTNITFENIYMSDVSGAGDPEKDIDFEPNTNCKINNCYVKNCICLSGIRIYNASDNTSTGLKNIKIDNCKVKDIGLYSGCNIYIYNNDIYQGFNFSAGYKHYIEVIGNKIQGGFIGWNPSDENTDNFMYIVVKDNQIFPRNDGYALGLNYAKYSFISNNILNGKYGFTQWTGDWTFLLDNCYILPGTSEDRPYSFNNVTNKFIREPQINI